MSNVDWYQKKYQRSVDSKIRGGSNPYPDPQPQPNYATADQTEPLNVTTQSFVTSPINGEIHHSPARPIPQTQPFKAYSPNALSPDTHNPRQQSIPKIGSPETAYTSDRIDQLKDRLRTVRAERDAAIQKRDDAIRERDEATADKDNMLTEFVAMEESLDDAKRELRQYQDELSSLQSSNGQQYTRGRGRAVNGEVSNEYHEREQSYQDDSQLRSQLQRLQRRVARAEAHADQLQSQQTTNAAQADYQVHAAETKASKAMELVNFHQSQADTYLRQLIELRDSNSASAAAAAAAKAEQESQRSKTDTQALERLKTDLDDARKLSDFFKNNSDAAAKKNREIIDENRQLQDSLYAKNREVQEQKGLIEALRLQMNDNIPGQFPGRA